MKFAILPIFGLIFCLAAPAGAGQVAPATAPVYVNENQTDPPPLKLRDVAGSVRGLGGDAMSMATVSLFTEDGHALVASVVSDRNGKFKFNKVDKGRYRVVARVAGLCTANIPIDVGSSLLANRKLEITMQPKDDDKCSYGMAKR